ncbi:MAG: GAF domain-containing protein [Phormidesmis sp.]
MNEREFAEITLRTQNKLLAKIAKGDSFPEILNALVEAIEQNLDQAFCSIFLLDKDNRFRLGAAPNLPNEYSEGANGRLSSDDMSPCGRAVSRRKTVIVSDIAKASFAPSYQDFALSCGLRACWSMPVFGSDGRVLGTFATYYQTVRSPQTYELNTIAQMAHLTGIAIERQQAEERLYRSETMLLEAQEISQVGNWSFDVASQAVTWSPGMFRLYGLASTAATLKTHKEALSDDPRSRPAQST